MSDTLTITVPIIDDSNFKATIANLESQAVKMGQFIHNTWSAFSDNSAVKAATKDLTDFAGKLGTVSDAMKTMNEALKNGKELKGTISSLGQSDGGGGASKEEKTPTSLQQVGGVISNVGDAASSVGQGINQAAAGISTLVTAAQTLSKAGNDTKVMFAALGGSIIVFAEVFASIGTELTAASGGMLAFGATLLMVGAAVALVGLGINLIAKSLPLIVANGGKAAPIFVVLANALLPLAQAMALLAVPLLVVAVALAIVAVSAVVFAAAIILLGVGLLIVTAALALMQAVLPALVPFVQLTAIAFMQFGVALGVFAVAGLAALVVVALLALSFIALGAAGILAGAGLGIAAVAMGLLAAAIAAVGVALVVLSGGVLAFYSTIRAIFGAVGGTIAAGMSVIPKIFSNAWNGALSFLKGINLASIGSDIINGFVRGIQGAWGAVKAVIGNLSNMIPSGIKKLLHIGSPSRLMRDEVGQWIPAGIAVGISQNTSSLVSATRSMGNAVVNAAGGILPSFSKMSNEMSTALTPDFSNLNALAANAQTSFEGNLNANYCWMEWFLVYHQRFYGYDSAICIK